MALTHMSTLCHSDPALTASNYYPIILIIYWSGRGQNDKVLIKYMHYALQPTKRKNRRSNFLPPFWRQFLS
jgi:hypothetical protein